MTIAKEKDITVSGIVTLIPGIRILKKESAIRLRIFISPVYMNN
jgi:hypothetical protein